MGIAKSFGVIQSPAWQELLPFFSLVFAGGAMYQKIRYIEGQVSRISLH